jgi:uncharacterized membrane protein YfcA
MNVLFPTSGVTTFLWLPPAVALGISFLTSMGGVSGAFLLLPFQMSVLGFVSPAVSPTNLVFNIVAIPSGVYRYLREGRMVWPLTWTVAAGTLPGVLAGGFVRLHWLPDPRPFKAFVGCVLLYIGARLLVDGIRSRVASTAKPDSFVVEVLEFNWRRIAYRFEGADHACASASIFMLSLAVGLVGGVYGIGGGAIIAPFFVAIYKLPVHTVAGATLMGTFVTSIVGVLFYQLIAPWYGHLRVAPDWALGALFGVGGIVGMYLGARTQRFVPARWLKVLLAGLILIVAGRYVVGWLAMR